MDDKDTGCVDGMSIVLSTGALFSLTKPDPAQITFRVIGEALGKICRFGAQCPEFYSVAEHSVLCARLALEDGQPWKACRAVLMHDAAEAFVGDMIRPIKRSLPSYRVIEHRIKYAIWDKFELDDSPDLREEIALYDNTMLRSEQECFWPGATPWPGLENYPCKPKLIRCLSPQEASREFLSWEWILQ